MKIIRSLIWIALILICGSFAFNVSAQKKSTKARLGKICGNPQNDCRTNDEYFQRHEIPFEIPVSGNVVIVESEPFYAIILKR